MLKNYVPFMLILIIPICTESAHQMPRFVYSQSNKLLLVANDVWEAGTQNSMAILSEGESITLRLRVAGVPAGSELKRTILLRCPSYSADGLIDLGIRTPAIPICYPQISFRLSSISVRDEFKLTMSSSSLRFDSVFSSKVTLTAKVEYDGGGVLMSNTLSIWNLDPISSFPANSPNPAGYERRFLTETAISLMTRMNLGTGNFHNVQFLDSRMVSALQSAPNFFRQKLNLGAILYFDPAGCGSVHYDRGYLFNSFDENAPSILLTRLKTMLLDRRTGILWYSRCQLYKSVAQFYVERGSPSNIAICLAVSFSGDVIPYNKISSVNSRIPNTEFSYTTCSDPLISVCFLVPGTQQNVTIYSGMDNTQLICPIICDDPTIVFTFTRNGQPLIPPTSSDWSDFGTQGVRIARTSNIIEFSKDVSSSQAGVYVCSAGIVSFTYYVSVVSMPTFSVTIGSQSATVPPKVFAMQGESLSYSCGVTYSGLGFPVSFQPKFFFPIASGGVLSWTELSLSSFNSFVSPSGSSAVSISTPSVGSGAQLMNVSIASVPPVNPSFGYNFTHRFVCNASVSGADATELGMSSFSAQSGGDVVYVSRPTKDSFVLGPNNDCATQKCHLGNGATFEFAMSPQYSDYLSENGIDVDLYLRIDNLLLTDVKILMSSNVSVITANGTSIKYQILPITSEAVRTELQKRSTLTPVYNFRYRNAAEMGNVNLLKSRYGSPVIALGSKDCRTDPLCFYSTDFDTSGGLSFLSVTLDFSGLILPTTNLINTTNKTTTSMTTTGSQANLTIIIVVIVLSILIIVLVVLATYFYKFRKTLDFSCCRNSCNADAVETDAVEKQVPPAVRCNGNDYSQNYFYDDFTPSATVNS